MLGNLPAEMTELRTIDYSSLMNSSTGRFILLQINDKYEFLALAEPSHAIEVPKGFQITIKTIIENKKKKKKNNSYVLLTNIMST